MKAAAVDYARPRSLGEALDLLGRDGIEARAMAGGQSLVAMMNLRLAAPDLVVDIARLPELSTVAEYDDSVTFGACVTHAAIEDGAFPDPSRGLMPHAAAGLAHRAIRNRGTLGGSLALADPAAEWPAVLVALNAAAVVAGPVGRATVACTDFITGIYETRVAAGELIVGIQVPKLSPAARWGYVKLARKAGEFALSLGIVVCDPARGYGRVVVGAADGPPLVLESASHLAAAGDLAAVGDAIADDLAAAERGFDDFRRDIHAAAARRAARQAAA